MDGGKRKVEDPAPNEAERRQLRARRGYAIAAEQFWPLIRQVDRWMEQHRAPREGQEEQNASDVEDGATPASAGEGLSDTINSILKRLERNEEASQVADPMPALPPADPTPHEAPLAGAEPEVLTPTGLKPEAPLAEPKSEAPPR